MKLFYYSVNETRHIENKDDNQLTDFLWKLKRNIC